MLLQNKEIEVWSNTCVVLCKYYVSQKQNEFNNKSQRYSILFTVISKLSFIFTNGEIKLEKTSPGVVSSLGGLKTKNPEEEDPA